MNTIRKSQKESKKGSGRWSKGEHHRFMLGLSRFGRNWVEVQKLVRTRTLVQVRSHAQKVFLRMSESDNQSSIYQREADEGFDLFGDSEVSQTEQVTLELQKNQVSMAIKTPTDLVQVFMKAIQQELMRSAQETCIQQEKQNMLQVKEQAQSDESGPQPMGKYEEWQTLTVWNE